MDALDLKFDTDYRVTICDDGLKNGDIVRRCSSSLDDKHSVKFQNGSGNVGFLIFSDVEEIVPDDPQINFNTLKTALESPTTIIPPEVNNAEQLEKWVEWVDALPCESHCGNSGLPKDSTHYQHTLLQPLEIMQRIMAPEEFKGFLKGNILKYSIRGGNKQGEPAEKDLGKVETYSRWLRLAEQGKTINPMLD